MGGRACARPIRWVLRHQHLRELQSTTWQRQAGKGEELLDKENEGAKRWKKPLESSEALKEGEV
jgi:hypothetical protein